MRFKKFCEINDYGKEESKKAQFKAAFQQISADVEIVTSIDEP